MLLAARDPNAHRLQGAAESLPLSDACCDLMTVALSFHWMDRERFLLEAGRVLRPFGWLVIYNNYFLGRMRENASFQRWVNVQYLKRYPVPPRSDQPLTTEEAAAFGFIFVERQAYANEVTFDVDELASYLMTSTNIVVAVQSGITSYPKVQQWLTEALGPLFPAPRCTFDFGGYIWYLRAA
jgi:SAM-dependent methyltransferase